MSHWTWQPVRREQSLPDGQRGLLLPQPLDVQYVVQGKQSGLRGCSMVSRVKISCFWKLRSVTFGYVFANFDFTLIRWPLGSYGFVHRHIWGLRCLQTIQLIPDAIQWVDKPLSHHGLSTLDSSLSGV